MNAIVNKFLLVGDKFMPKMHLRQPGYRYRACGPFTKNKERIKKFKETGNSRYTYRNELDKACFQHDMIWPMEILKTKIEGQLLIKYYVIKAVDIAKNIKCDRYQRGLASMVYELFEKKLLLVALKMKIFLVKN